MHHIALITYDTSPYRGSESSVSWNYIIRMSKYFKLTVIYGQHKDEVDRFLSEHSVPNVEWIHMQKKPTLHGGMLGHLEYMRNYRHWQMKTFNILSEKVKNKEIDLIHYLNPIGFKEPGYCWKIEGTPYVWGPIACVENRPLPLYKAYDFTQKLSTLTRRIAHNALFRLMPRLKKALKNADKVFAATPNGIRLLKKHHHCNAEYLPENGIIAMENTTPISYDPTTPLQLIWIGRTNDPDKALVIMLDALSKTSSPNYHLHVVGPGEPSKKIKQRVDNLKGKVTFHGKVTRDQVQSIMLNSHLHVISSLGEGNPTVIWEAMAKAIPTMTLDHCGMAGVVCEKCGIKIPIQSYRHTTDRIAREIDDIIQHPERINHLSNGVIQCSKKFMWKNRIDLFINTYSQLIDKYNQ